MSNNNVPESAAIPATISDLVKSLHEEFITPELRAKVSEVADKAFEEIFEIIHKAVDGEIRGRRIHSNITFRIPAWNVLKVVTPEATDEKTLVTHQSVPSGVLCSRLFSEALRKRLVDFGFAKKDDGELVCTVELRRLLGLN